MKRNNKIMFAIAAAMLLLAALLPAQASAQQVNFQHAAYVAAGNSATSIPVGHAEFCRSHADECGRNANPVQAMTLTQARWDELLTVNADINTRVVPVTDQQLYKVNEFWTYPNGYGDCEDFVLAKRRALIERGWAPSTLLITVVKQLNGEGHAVLIARTDRGDLVLDNQEGLIKVWNETPYQYIKRQSQADAGTWVDLYDDRPITVASR